MSAGRDHLARIRRVSRPPGHGINASSSLSLYDVREASSKMRDHAVNHAAFVGSRPPPYYQTSNVFDCQEQQHGQTQHREMSAWNRYHCKAVAALCEGLPAITVLACAWWSLSLGIERLKELFISALFWEAEFCDFGGGGGGGGGGGRGRSGWGKLIAGTIHPRTRS